MPKFRVAPTATALIFVVAVAAAACGSSSTTSSSTTTTAASSSKAAFCGAQKTLNKASVNVTSPAGFLAVLQANKAAVDTFANNIPSGAIRADAEKLVAAARTALATNNPSALTDPSIMGAGGNVDTYCGVDGSGNPLPANFGAGKGSAFCANQAAISSGVQAASTPQDLVAFLKANEAKINDFAAKIPSAVQNDAQTLVTAARTAISTNDGTKIQTPAVNDAAMHVDSYCGVNH